MDLDQKQTTISNNENLRAVLNISHDRVNHLSSLNQANILFTASVIIGLCAILWKDPQIIVILCVPVLILWRVNARIIDNEIINQYGKIISCEGSLSFPAKFSLTDALIEKFPYYRKVEYANLSNEEKNEQFLYLIKTRQISHRQHDIFDLIAIVGIFICLILMIYEFKIENLIQNWAFCLLIIILFLIIWWIIENLFVLRTPPPVKNFDLSKRDKIVFYAQLIVSILAFTFIMLTILFAIFLIMFIDWVLIYWITHSHDTLYLSIILLPLIVFFGIWMTMKNIPISTHKMIQEAEQAKSDVPHHAIIIAHLKQRNADGSFAIADYFDGVDILIQKFSNHNPTIPFRIYEVSSREEVIPVFFNENATHLWIFGHGKRHQLGLFQDRLNYYDVKKCPKKEFIGQYHCNSQFWLSFVDYNNPTHHDVTWWFRFGPFIRNSVRRKLNDLGI